MKVLVVGYGSIGKQHVEGLISLGINPVVLTKYPNNNSKVEFISELENWTNIDHAIICTPTYLHENTFNKLVKETKIKNILIEKPIAHCVESANNIKQLSEKYRVNVSVAFDMRFIESLNTLKNKLHHFEKKIRIVKITCGQFLPTWRPDTDYRNSYSSKRNMGGGVDLDLTHEIDYMIWLFGIPRDIKFLLRDNLSNLEISSPDYFKAIYRYANFVVDVELDYIRSLSRKLEIIGENSTLAELDFIKNKLIINNSETNSVYQEESSLQLEIKEFIFGNDNPRLCSINESIEVLKNIKL
jgi:predicted dehydrogenase